MLSPPRSSSRQQSSRPYCLHSEQRRSTHRQRYALNEEQVVCAQTERETGPTNGVTPGIMPPPHPITSTLTSLMNHFGATVEIDGNLTCEEDLTIEGHLTGNIEVRDAILIVAPP